MTVSKFTKENARAVVRAMVAMKRTCDEIVASGEGRKKDLHATAYESRALWVCISMMRNELGIEWEPYDDESL